MWDDLTPASVGRQLDMQSLSNQVALIDRVHQSQPKINRLVTSYLMRAFDAVGMHSHDFESMKDEDACRELLQKKGVPASKLWWLQLLAEIALANDCCRENVSKLRDELATELPFYDIELTLINRVGGELDQLMVTDGTSLIVHTLFADDLMTRWYTDGVTYQVFNQLARQATQTLLKSAGERQVNVLEVGAGTGGLTSHLLDLFAPERTRFAFTDVGAFFLRSGRRRFAEYPFVDFKVFDLESCGREQGFEAGSFDLVIANNVIHDTRNIAGTLTNLKELMSPGGMMLMLELTDPQIWWHMCFGSLDGWWRFKSDPTDPRTKLMLLQKQEWLDVLHEAGFAETSVLSDQLPSDFANRLFLSQFRR